MATMTYTVPLHATRYHHTAIKLNDGKVLVAGGRSGASFITTCELYDPVAQTWTYTNGPLNLGREWPTANLLTNGKVLIIGGLDNNSLKMNTCELYDPATGLWTPTGSTINPRYQHQSILLQNGKVLVISGSLGFGGDPSCELYDPPTEQWTGTGSLATGRNRFAAIRENNGRVLMAGGSTGGAGISSSEEYDPGTAQWTTTSSMNAGRMLYNMVMRPSGDVLTCGSSASCDYWNGGGWSSTGSVGGVTSLLLESTAVALTNGTTLLLGGQTAFNVVTSSCQIYNDNGHNTVGSWVSTASLNTPRFKHTSTLLNDGSVLTVGGWSTTGGSQLATCELYTYVAPPTTLNLDDSMTLADPNIPRVLQLSGSLKLGEWFTSNTGHDGIWGNRNT